jgi:hypothetical protein
MLDGDADGLDEKEPSSIPLKHGIVVADTKLLQDLLHSVLLHVISPHVEIAGLSERLPGPWRRNVPNLLLPRRGRRENRR